MPMSAGSVAQAASQLEEKVGGQALGGFEFVKGLQEAKRSKRELDRLNRQLYQIQPEYFENRNLAAVEAGQGLTSAAKDYMTSEAGRSLGAGIGALTQTGGGSVNDIAKLTDIYNRSTRQIGAEDAEKQLANIQYFMNTNKELAGQKTMKWAINEYQPYQAKLKELQDRQAAAQQNIMGGLQMILGANSANNTANSNQALLNNLFKNTKGNDYAVGSDSPVAFQQVAMPQTVPLGTGPNTSSIPLPSLPQ